MKTILLAEDDHDIRFLYASKLRLEGYEVLEAKDGVEGLKIIARQKPDLCLIDLNMPLIGGLELIRQLRASDKNADLKIVVLTNISKNEAPHALRYMNVLAYTLKAYTTPVQLAREVARWLED